jgi:predicted transcriptional regulator
MPQSSKSTNTKTAYLDIRVPADVKQMLEQLAAEQNRSQTAEIIWLIKQEFARQKSN